MKRNYRRLIKVILGSIAGILFLVFVVPNVYLALTYNQIADNTKPLYRTTIVQFEIDQTQLCVETQLEGLITLIPALLDGQIVPFSRLDVRHVTTGTLMDEYEADVICTGTERQPGFHTLRVLSHYDLTDVRSTDMLLEVNPAGLIVVRENSWRGD